jgi:hypothetical protein
MPPEVSFSGSWIPSSSTLLQSAVHGLAEPVGMSASSCVARNVQYMQPVSVRGPRLIQTSLGM